MQAIAFTELLSSLVTTHESRLGLSPMDDLYRQVGIHNQLALAFMPFSQALITAVMTALPVVPGLRSSPA